MKACGVTCSLKHSTGLHWRGESVSLKLQQKGDTVITSLAFGRLSDVQEKAVRALPPGRQAEARAAWVDTLARRRAYMERLVDNPDGVLQEVSAARGEYDHSPAGTPQPVTELVLVCGLVAQRGGDDLGRVREAATRCEDATVRRAAQMGLC